MNPKKLLNYLLLFIFFIGIQSTSLAQNEECGFQFTPENKVYYDSIKKEVKKIEQQFLAKKKSSNSSTLLTSVPIKAHIIRTSSGTGGLTFTQLNDAIAVMNSIYTDAGLEFFLCAGINYIDSDLFYDFSKNQESALTTPNNISNVVNIYFANSITNDSGIGICGYAYYPGGPETIVMKNSCAVNESTLSHEMGHFFSLNHTHGSSSVEGSTQELVDGSNCDTTGDFICDTPADPKLGYGNVSLLCTYTGAAQDANFDYYQPDATNIMSYSRKECRTFFSQLQYARIYATSQVSRNNLVCASFNADFAADETIACSNNLTVNFTDNSVGATSWNWDINGDDIVDYTTQNPTHTYSTNGNYDVALTISDGATSINTIKPQYINIGAIETGTENITLTLNLDGSPEETSWQFLDSNNTVLYSGGPYLGIFDANSIRTATFDINTGECYSFEIIDSAGNGLCCSNGNGSYELRAQDNSLLASGSDFSTLKTNNFYSGTLSINEFSRESISLFPNPTSNIITITSKSVPDSYSIYNALGMLVKQSQINSDIDLTIDIESFIGGVYFIKLTKANSNQVLSFIKK